MEIKNTYTVLLADDDKNIRDLLQQYLKKMDYIVTSVADGKEALEKFSKFHFDICVLDINMPYLNGIELVNKIKALKPDAMVIFITGVATEEDIQEIYNEDKEIAIIKKPFKCQTVGNYLAMMANKLSIRSRESNYRKCLKEQWKSLPFHQKLVIKSKRFCTYLHESFIIYLLFAAIILSFGLVQVYTGVTYVTDKTSDQNLNEMYGEIKDLLKDWKVKDLKKDEK